MCNYALRRANREKSAVATVVTTIGRILLLLGGTVILKIVLETVKSLF